ncbi:hypothetical protein ACIA8K_02865 [Catenuloplanes sp. NPDC051500]|uniref:hypothetical protein n=1 Tax=Catenuloplanes sp. NPDC051500 TaxID=3363959 RepID=UPI00379A3078
MSVETGGRGRMLMIGAAAVGLVAFVVVATLIADWDAVRLDPSAERHFRADSGIPAEYQALIVEAGTGCPEAAHVTPPLVASILKASTDFDPDVSDPAKHEYGIARWKQGMLREYLPAGERTELPPLPFTPEVSIAAVGEFLCRHASEQWVTGSPRGPEIELAFGFRATMEYGRDTFGTEAGWTGDAAYLSRVEQALATYRPE